MKAAYQAIELFDELTRAIKVIRKFFPTLHET